MNVKVESRAGPLSIDIEKTALLIVDMQNDFGTRGGMFDRAGIDISTIEGVVPPIKRLLEATRRAGIPSVYLKMGYRADLSDTGFPDAPNWIKHSNLHIGGQTTAPDGREGRILIRDTWNTDIVDELRPKDEDIVIYKTRYSGFYATELHSILQRKAVRYLIVTGCTTSVCVESTIRDAMFRDYCCILPADCTAEPGRKEFPRANHDASLTIIQARFGWVTESESVIHALESAAKTAVNL